MSDLSTDFQRSRIISVDLQVPLLARQALSRLAQITGTRDICIAGGFPRGLYMQQVLGLSPQMNDIDVFADLSRKKFDSVECRLEKEFGQPIRFHIGKFEKEESPLGLVEFSLPESLRENCAGVESLQLNFGVMHPWANAFKYVTLANAGINQVAIHLDGRVIASQSFIDDMAGKTMTMNPGRHWTVYHWHRTAKALERMQTERPEFRGWKTIWTEKPTVPDTGTFWESQKSPLPEPSTYY